MTLIMYEYEPIADTRNGCAIGSSLNKVSCWGSMVSRRWRERLAMSQSTYSWYHNEKVEDERKRILALVGIGLDAAQGRCACT